MSDTIDQKDLVLWMDTVGTHLTALRRRLASQDAQLTELASAVTRLEERHGASREALHDLTSAVRTLEQTLGVRPQGTAASVADRLAALDGEQVIEAVYDSETVVITDGHIVVNPVTHELTITLADGRALHGEPPQEDTSCP